MDWTVAISFDAVVMSAIACLIIREVILVAAPESVAGPGGWLIDTDEL